ncbi:hypothetical protein STEG23_009895 [Scotinomys teguina]
MVRWPTEEVDDKQHFEKLYRDAMLCERKLVNTLQDTEKKTLGLWTEEWMPRYCKGTWVAIQVILYPSVVFDAAED